MAAPATPRRRALAAQIALATRYHGPDAPQLAPMRAELAAVTAEDQIRDLVDQAPGTGDPGTRRALTDVATWAARAAATMPRLTPAEIAAVGRLAAQIDARTGTTDEG